MLIGKQTITMAVSGDSNNEWQQTCDCKTQVSNQNIRVLQVEITTTHGTRL